MTRIIFVFGGLAGAVIIASTILDILLGVGHSKMHLPEWVDYVIGYVIMLAGLTLVFVGVKRYRDVALGGVIRFTTALGVSLGIAAVSSAIYVLGWEAYLWATGYTFFNDYAKSVIDAKRAAGASPAEIAKLTAAMAEMSREYARPLNRMVMTLFEIAPVGVVVAVISAGLIRMRGFLPARGRES